MPQLIMNWENDGAAPETVELPEDCTLVRLPQMENAVNEWLDILYKGITSERRDEAYFQSRMVEHFDYDPNQCFFVLVNGTAAATFSVFCNRETKSGYIHMVSCKEEYRGRGIGTLMCRLIVKELKENGMRNAYLTTDDFRIPAIRSYLRAGFVPDESTDDFRVRWKAIRELIGQ